MPLTDQQIAELNAAVNKPSYTDIDQKNFTTGIAQGWKPQFNDTPPPTPTNNVIDLGAGYDNKNATTLNPATPTAPDFATSFDMQAELNRIREQQAAKFRAQGEEAKGVAREDTQDEKGVSTALGSKGGQAGVGFDSIVYNQLVESDKRLAKREKEIDAAVSEAILSSDESYINKVMQLQKDTRDAYYQNQTLLMAQEKAKLDELTTKYGIAKSTPKGTTVKLGDTEIAGLAEPEAFFKSADIVDFMKALPIGESQEITDPATGTVYTITGMASNDPNTQVFESEDASGNVSYVTIDKNTGQPIGQYNAGKIGKGFKATGGGGGSSNSAFQKAIDKGISNLQKGESWGTVWNRVKQEFPDASNEQIDIALGPEWKESGAFETWKQKQYKQGEQPQWQLQSGVWSWLATEGANLSNDEKKQQIMEAGFNPEDFGLY